MMNFSGPNTPMLVLTFRHSSQSRDLEIISRDTEEASEASEAGESRKNEMNFTNQ